MRRESAQIELQIYTVGHFVKWMRSFLAKIGIDTLTVVAIDCKLIQIIPATKKLSTAFELIVNELTACSTMIPLIHQKQVGSLVHKLRHIVSAFSFQF